MDSLIKIKALTTEQFLLLSISQLSENIQIIFDSIRKLQQGLHTQTINTEEWLDSGNEIFQMKSLMGLYNARVNDLLLADRQVTGFLTMTRRASLTNKS